MLIDALGRSIELSAAPQRIVSLVPSLTEYLFEIGAGARVVGITDYCMSPAEHLTNMPRVGGTKNPGRARIRALQPDLVLASKEENRQHDIGSLEADGIPVYVTNIESVAGAVEQLAVLADILEVGSAAAVLLDRLREALDQEHETSGRYRPRTLAFIWRDPWMAIGRQTYAADLLRICGADNPAIQLVGRYPRAALAAFMRLDPEIILLPDEPYHFSSDDQTAFASFGPVAAVRTGRIYLCDGQLLTWYGSRTVEALRVFRALLS